MKFDRGDEVHWFQMTITCEGVQYWSFTGIVDAVERQGVCCTPNGGGTPRFVADGFAAPSYGEMQELARTYLRELRNLFGRSVKTVAREIDGR